MRGYKYIGYIRNPLGKEKWSCYLRSEAVYMFTIDDEGKPVEKVKVFKSKNEIRNNITENGYKAFLTIFS